MRDEPLYETLGHNLSSVCVALLWLAPDSEAEKKGASGINANILLYEGSLGWAIWSAKSGAEPVDSYTTGKLRKFEAGILLNFSAFEHMVDEQENSEGSLSRFRTVSPHTGAKTVPS